MKWIKNGNQLINMAHVKDIEIIIAYAKENPKAHLVLNDKNDSPIASLKFDNLETAEAHIDAIAMFLEHQHTTIMAMAPTQEE